MRAVDVRLGQVTVDAPGETHQQVAQAFEDGSSEGGVGFDGVLGGAPQAFQRLRHHDATLHEHAPHQMVHGHLRVDVLDELVAVGVVHVEQAAKAADDRSVGSAQQAALGERLA